jgi:hypothetical protein
MDKAQLVADLKEARRLVAEVGWTRGMAARDANGDCVAATDDEAVCFCAIGALVRATDSVTNNRFVIARKAVSDVIPVSAATIVQYNDHVATREDVIALFDRAIAAAESEQ